MDIAIKDLCGIKIPLVSPQNSIVNFKNAIELLIKDKKHLERLKQEAKERALEISWDRLVEEIAADYTEIYKFKQI